MNPNQIFVSFMPAPVCDSVQQEVSLQTSGNFLIPMKSLPVLAASVAAPVTAATLSWFQVGEPVFRFLGAIIGLVVGVLGLLNQLAIMRERYRKDITKE